jgi:hypothetical protein
VDCHEGELNDSCGLRWRFWCQYALQVRSIEASNVAEIETDAVHGVWQKVDVKLALPALRDTLRKKKKEVGALLHLEHTVVAPRLSHPLLGLCVRVQCRLAGAEIDRLQTLKSNLSDQLDSLLVGTLHGHDCTLPSHAFSLRFRQEEKAANTSELMKRAVESKEVRGCGFYAGNMDAGNAIAWGEVYQQNDKPRVAVCRCGHSMVIGGNREDAHVLEQCLGTTVKRSAKKRKAKPVKRMFPVFNQSRAV